MYKNLLDYKLKILCIHVLILIDDRGPANAVLFAFCNILSVCFVVFWAPGSTKRLSAQPQKGNVISQVVPAGGRGQPPGDHSD